MSEFFGILQERLDKTAFREIEVRNQEVIFQTGAPAQAFYFVLEGQVAMQRVLENGDFVIVHHAKRAEFFAEASLFASHYHCDAVATSDARVCAISREAFIAAMKNDPELGLAFASNLAQNTRDYRQILEIRSIKSAKLRVYAGIELGLLNAPIHNFASQIGITEAACYRALRQLVNEGTVRQLGRGRYALN